MQQAARRLGAGDLDDLLEGAAVLASGGGGSLRVARGIAQALGAAATLPALLALDQLADAAWVAAPVILGGGLSQAELDALPMLAPEPAVLRAAEGLQRRLGRAFDAIYPIEIGPQNSLEAVRLAALLGVPVLDADGCGRAVPELQQTSFSAGGHALTPFVLATFQGDLIGVDRLGDLQRGEALCRALAQASGGVLALCGFVLEGAAARATLLPGGLSRCLALGRALRATPRPDLAELATAAGGSTTFTGRVVAMQVALQGGFFRGALRLAGEGADTGSDYRIAIQNEYLWSWRNGRAEVAAPELLCVLDAESARGLAAYGNGFERSVAVGDRVVVWRLPADPFWQAPAHAALFPPAPALGELPC